MPVFVDTNLFVYSLDTSEPEKQERAREWLERLWDSGDGRVSVQVLQELYSTLTRRLDHSLDPEEARKMVKGLFAWNPIPVNHRTIEGAWSLQDRYSLSWWDALIVSAARIAGCERLLTEDLSDRQDLDGVVVMNPFR